MESREQLTLHLRKGLPAPREKHGEVSLCLVKMQDGVQLNTRIYTPAGKGPWPVILVRNPYSGLLPYLDLTALILNEYGYVVVLQDCRGTGDSEGIWKPFINERLDGLDTLYWMIKQPWMNGNIGTYGHSYLTAAQWAMADQLPKEVKTMVLSGFTTERYRQNYMNGMFRQDVYTGWALDNAGVEPLIQGDLFEQAIKITPHIEIDERLFGTKLPWYREWITNSSPLDTYWSDGFWAELKDIPTKMTIPLLMVDGWFDQHLDGMIRDYMKLPENTRENSRFIVGPWVHSLAAAGDFPFPDSERNLLLEALLWFDHHLQGMEYPHKKGSVETYVIGKGKWLEWSQWSNPKNVLTWKLNGVGIGSYRLDRQLEESGEVSFTYDPCNPVPTHGGAGLLRYLSGSINAALPSSVLQAAPGTRDDVISFLSDPLEDELCIVGSIVIHLYVSTDVPDTAFSATIMEVRPDGSTFNIRDGITSLAYRNGAERPVTYEIGSITEVEITLWPITWTIQRGSQIRLDVSSSNFPAYHVHANKAGPWASQVPGQAAYQRIYYGKELSSQVIIPYSKKGNRTDYET